MDIQRSGSQPSGKGPAEYFTGTVRTDPLFQAADPARTLAVSVTVEPGARTAWHTHPLGQTLIVTAGCGWAQRWGGPIWLNAVTVNAKVARPKSMRQPARANRPSANLV